MGINGQLVRDGFMIMRRFGMRHALGRARDLIRVKREERRRTALYNRIRPEGTIVREILGNRMTLDMSDRGIHRDLFLDGIREPAATRHLMSVLTPDDVVLDIGANIGYYVLMEAARCRKVYAVEPVPRNVAVLTENVRLNGYDNVEIFSLAFGRAAGMERMYLSAKSNWHSFHPAPDTVGRIDIPVETVDAFLRGRECPTLVRMDVEGYEINIIDGMTETLPRIGRMFIELHADIMSLEETRRLIDTVRGAGFAPELIVKYDRPGMSRILPDDYVDTIYEGDKGSYEIFFRKRPSP